LSPEGKAFEMNWADIACLAAIHQKVSFSRHYHLETKPTFSSHMTSFPYFIAVSAY